MHELSEPKTDSLSGRDPALDGVRAIACLMVYFYHLGFDLRRPPLVVEGFTGVMVFFVLSGYLMFGPYAAALTRERAFPGWRSYAIRRFTRIFPPYLVALFIYTVVRYAMEAMRPGGTRSAPPGVAGFVSHVLLVFNYIDRRQFFAICGVFWSLAIEAQFYAILPISCTIAARLGACTRLSVMAFVIVFGAIGPLSRALEHRYFDRHDVSDQLPRFVAVTSYLDLFAAGMGLAVLSRSAGGRRRAPASRRWTTFFIGATLFLVAENWSLAVAGTDWQTSPSLVYTTFYATASTLAVGLMLLALVTRPAVAAWPLTWAPLVKLGEISYSVYLYHVLVQVGILNIVSRSFSDPGRWRDFAAAMIAFVPTMIIAALGYYLVERPALAWGLRHSAHKAAVIRILDDTSLRSEASRHQ